MATVAELESVYGIPPGLFAKLLARGEASGATATSPKGAYGTAQLMPAAAADMGVDRYDPDQNLEGGAKYLASMAKRYGGDWGKAVAAYNEGPGRVDRGVVLPETKSYLQRIFGMPAAGTAAIPGVDGGLQGVLGQLLAPKQDPQAEALFKAAQASRAEAGEATRKNMAQEEAILTGMQSETPPTPPDAMTAPKPPKEEPGDPTRVLGQFLPMLAILGGALSKGHAINALKAATGAMQGAQTADADAIKRHHDQWMDSMSELKSNYEMKRDAYDDAEKKYEGDTNAKLAQLRVIAAQNGDALGLAALDSGNLTDWFNMRRQEDYSADKVFQIYDRAQTLKDHESSMDPAKAAYWDAKDRGASEEDALKALRTTELAEKPGLSGTQARADKASFEKEPAVQAYQKAQPFFETVDKALNDPSFLETNSGQIALLDGFTKAITGGQAVRGFMVKGVTDNMAFQDQVETWLSKLNANHGLKMPPELARQMAETASQVKDGMQQLYDKKGADDFNSIMRQGRDPSDSLPTEDIDRWTQNGLVTIPPQGGQPASAAQSPAAKPFPMPQVKADLVKDQLYQTSRGPAYWRGDHFEVP